MGAVISSGSRAPPPERPDVIEGMSALNLSISAGGAAELPPSSQHGRLSLEVRGRGAPVHIDFPAPAGRNGAWETEAARARFSKKKHELTVTMPLACG